MNINFELYKVFYIVANEKSISKGAEKLLISQPAVTASIKTLENELGGTLFIRTPKGVILTNEGLELYNYITEGMKYFINGANKFMSMKNLESGTINIGCTSTISEYYLINYLKEFHELFPNIDINITNDLTDNLIKLLRNGSIDIVISSIPDNDIKDLEIHYLKDLKDTLIGNIKYKDIIFNDYNTLFKENIILPKTPSVTRNNFDKHLKDNNLVCNPSMEVVSQNLLISLVENGFGIGLVTKNFILDKLNNTLFEVNNPLNIPKRKLGYIIKKNSIPNFATKKFIELLKE